MDIFQKNPGYRFLCIQLSFEAGSFCKPRALAVAEPTASRQSSAGLQCWWLSLKDCFRWLTTILLYLFWWQCCWLCTVFLTVQSVPDCARCSWLCTMLLTVQSVADCAECSWLCAVLLTVHGVADCAQCSWLCRVLLTVHSVPDCARCSWQCTMLLTVHSEGERCSWCNQCCKQLVNKRLTLTMTVTVMFISHLRLVTVE